MVNTIGIEDEIDKVKEMLDGGGVVAIKWAKEIEDRDKGKDILPLAGEDSCADRVFCGEV